MTYDHKYILEPQATGTKVTIEENYRGHVPFWDHGQMEPTRAKANQALKTRVLIGYSLKRFSSIPSGKWIYCWVD